MIHNKAGQFLGNEGASFATDDQQGSGDAYGHSLSSGPSSSIKQGLMDERRGRSRAGKQADAGASGTDTLAGIRDRSRTSAAAKYAPAEPAQRERFGGARPELHRAREHEPSASVSRTSTDLPDGSFASGVAFDGGGGHVTSGASGGAWGATAGAGAGRRGQKGWGTSGAVIGGRYTGVHEANFEDRNQQNLSSSLSLVRERGASENAPGSDASSVTDDDDGARDSARKGNAKETRKSRLGPSQSFAYQGPVDDFDPHRSEREEKILNAEDEEEKARLGLPTSFVRLSQKTRGS